MRPLEDRRLGSAFAVWLACSAWGLHRQLAKPEGLMAGG
jgi:hypothetical protein